MGTGAAWVSSAAAWHASCHALCPYPPWDGAGTAPASYFCCLACGCWGWGTPSPKGTRGSLTQVQWEAHRGQAGKGGVEMQSQTSSNSSLSLLAVPASNVPMIWQPRHPRTKGPQEQGVMWTLPGAWHHRQPQGAGCCAYPSSSAGLLLLHSSRQRDSSTQPPASRPIPSRESRFFRGVFRMLVQVPMRCVCRARLLLWALPLLLGVPVSSFALCSCTGAGHWATPGRAGMTGDVGAMWVLGILLVWRCPAPA